MKNFKGVFLPTAFPGSSLPILFSYENFPNARCRAERVDYVTNFSLAWNSSPIPAEILFRSEMTSLSTGLVIVLPPFSLQCFAENAWVKTSSLGLPKFTFQPWLKLYCDYMRFFSDSALTKNSSPICDMQPWLKISLCNFEKICSRPSHMHTVLKCWFNKDSTNLKHGNYGSPERSPAVFIFVFVFCFDQPFLFLLLFFLIFCSCFYCFTFLSWSSFSFFFSSRLFFFLLSLFFFLYFFNYFGFAFLFHLCVGF